MAPCSYPALPFQSAIGVESLSCPPIASNKLKWIPGLGLQSSGIAEIISSQIDALGENENRTPKLRLGGQERPFAGRRPSEVELTDRSVLKGETNERPNPIYDI
jgi:hypothetical protein